MGSESSKSVVAHLFDSLCVRECVCVSHTVKPVGLVRCLRWIVFPYGLRLLTGFRVQFEVQLLKRLCLDRLAVILTVHLSLLQETKYLPYIFADVLDCQLGDVCSKQTPHLLGEIGESEIVFARHLAIFNHLDFPQVRLCVEDRVQLEEAEL